MFAVEQTQKVAKLIESKDFDGALALRDPEFAEGTSCLQYISQITDDERVPEKKRMRMGVIHVGALQVV